MTTAKDRCLLSIIKTDEGFILGRAFLVDACVVHDLEGHEVSIAQEIFNNRGRDIEIILILSQVLLQLSGTQ